VTALLPVELGVLGPLQVRFDARQPQLRRLDDVGAVVTHTAHLVSRAGFEAEVRSVDILTVDGDRLARVEVFDEADLATALARFDELEGDQL
jgi:hypothetical protein